MIEAAINHLVRNAKRLYFERCEATWQALELSIRADLTAKRTQGSILPMTGIKEPKPKTISPRDHRLIEMVHICSVCGKRFHHKPVWGSSATGAFSLTICGVKCEQRQSKAKREEIFRKKSL